MHETPLESISAGEPATEVGPVTVRIKEGTSVVLRPVQPEDQPLLQELLESCSPTSLYHRFHYVTKRTREMAFRFCNLDDRGERVIVAEIESGDTKKLIGLGNLAADPCYRSAEMAILVTDHWQNKGVGGALADYCFDLAYRWGLQEVVAVTTLGNRQVIAMARKRRFRILCQIEDRTVWLNKKLHRKRKRFLGQVA
jgi:acetyltransferase